RPIGWISAVSAKGEINLSPYSFFNLFGVRPTIVAFSSDGMKDAVSFVRETGAFICNIATQDLLTKMSATSAPLPRGENEFLHAGLTMVTGQMVAVPRVKEAPAALECKLLQILSPDDLEGKPSGYHIVLGQVVGVHIDERFIKDGRLDTAAMQPLARCGYDDYAVVDKVIALERPPGAY
ncbi:MAG: flavin reductase family protein, partial [Beijerinckiaceae bacterium]